jgi:LPS export ABC transporter protein LptC
VLLSSALACDDAPPAPVAGEHLLALGADALVVGMENYLTTDGVRTGVVRADSAYQFNDSSVNHLFGVDMTLFNEQGQPRANLTSETGILHQRTEEMTARGNVILTVREQGVVIETEELFYDPSGERIWSDSASTFHREGQTQHGTCFNSDLAFTDITVCDPVGDIIRREPGGAGRPGPGSTGRPGPGDDAPTEQAPALGRQPTAPTEPVATTANGGKQR